MPNYKFLDTATGFEKCMYLSINELDQFTKDAEGNQIRDKHNRLIYTGPGFEEAQGDVVLMMGTWVKQGSIPPAASRKFGDKKRTPNFGQNKWT